MFKGYILKMKQRKTFLSLMYHVKLTEFYKEDFLYLFTLSTNKIVNEIIRY